MSGSGEGGGVKGGQVVVGERNAVFGGDADGGLVGGIDRGGGGDMCVVGGDGDRLIQ